jgi:hypothetical protein
MPLSTLYLAKLATALPWLQDMLRPGLERKGAKVKAEFRRKSGTA